MLSNYISIFQGIQRLKDFNIADEAGGGVGKAVIKNFNASVTNGTLEIRFYWAGKGTTGIPVTGVYGPLISAISVDPSKYCSELLLITICRPLRVSHM
ncbi:unnamed protein product [Prunus armeniaca]|uniref:Malectin domain-containing protein n=1 Tax=Prunus armeniaca TaxID=36596 RepID=A0A6J5UPR4_PRUAR|nr:unnamed protein product [Prunus armeniaca]CAB4308825.1 unnamed protein product [Prunus armeniaca]